jgi:hypothetical protein
MKSLFKLSSSLEISKSAILDSSNFLGVSTALAAFLVGAALNLDNK